MRAKLAWLLLSAGSTLGFAPSDGRGKSSNIRSRHPRHGSINFSPDDRSGSCRPTSLLELSRDDEITVNSPRSGAFTVAMALCGAALGPFLDAFHSAFGVLQYEEPITAILWGTPAHPALITAWWVPELFGLAGIIIGWLYIVLDSVLYTPTEQKAPRPTKILLGISIFTFQYWLSGLMFSMGVDRTTLFFVMSVLAGTGFATLDSTAAGFITSLATAIGGPLLEVGLLSALTGYGGYQYMDKGEFGFFPNWIVPVYFLGGPAVGNLARGIWNGLSV